MDRGEFRESWPQSEPQEGDWIARGDAPRRMKARPVQPCSRWMIKLSR
jgi:hypothetical protein